MTTGMQMIEAIRAERAAPPSGIRTLGLDLTHRWITDLGPGHVTFAWPVGSDHFNLEHAVICSWTAAVADQAIFFASNTLCGEGEGTRTTDLHLRALHNIGEGVVTVVCRIHDHTTERMFASCDFILADGRLAAQVTATLDITR
jgi:acyl-coenzyme A thioesterase PaaI-like protein